MKYFCFLIILLLPVNSFCVDIDITGYGATGFKTYERNFINKYKQETYYEGKLQTEIELNKDIEAQLDFRGNSNDNSVRLKEFSIKFDVYKYMNIKVGNVKKPFGFEQLENRDELKTVERSYAQDNLSEMGYGGRTVSLMFYNKFKEKNNIPITYYLSFYKNNSDVSGLAARFVYHFGDFAAGGDYIFRHSGAAHPMNTHGFMAEFFYEKKDFFSGLEIFAASDPIEGIRRKMMGLDNQVFTSGIKSISSMNIDIDGTVFKSIEPVFLFSIYYPEFEEHSNHVIQVLPAVNFYITKKVMLRFNADFQFTKNEFNTEYSTLESKGIIELMFRY